MKWGRQEAPAPSAKIGFTARLESRTGDSGHIRFRGLLMELLFRRFT